MLEKNSFDTICHEHLEYYSLKQIEWVCSAAGLKLVDVEFNDVNGGSFSIVATHLSNTDLEPSAALVQALSEERQYYSEWNERIEKFKEESTNSRQIFRNWYQMPKAKNVNVYCLGASTKGNVLLQYCGMDYTKIKAIGEVNEDKFGKFTPGSRIPIVPQDEILNDKSAYFIVLPWHFREFFEQNSKFDGLKLVFPLPELEILL